MSLKVKVEPTGRLQLDVAPRIENERCRCYSYYLHNLLLVLLIVLGTHYHRLATVQGKQGIWFLLSRQGKHREFCPDTGKNLLTHRKYLDCDY